MAMAVPGGARTGPRHGQKGGLATLLRMLYEDDLRWGTRPEYTSARPEFRVKSEWKVGERREKGGNKYDKVANKDKRRDFGYPKKCQ